MFSGKQFGVLGVIAGANLLLSLLVSTVGGSLGAQGPTGQTGPQGPQGETGEQGQAVEFDVVNNVLVWRYVGETEWRELDLEITGGGGSNINTGGGVGYFTHWMYDANPTFSFSYPNRIIVDDSASYAADLIANENFTGIATLEELVAIGNDDTSLMGNYVLTANIDLSTWVSNGNTNVIPGIFKGVLDGAGYEIANLTLDKTGDYLNGGALFSTLNSATVQNLNLSNFTYKGIDVSSSGALAQYVRADENQPVLIDQVNVVNFTVEATGGTINDVGGIFGQGDDEIYIVRSTTSDIVFKSQNNMNGVGGMFGFLDYDAVIHLYELDSHLETGFIDETSAPYFDRVGGLGGDIKANSTVLAYSVTSELTGYVEENSAGFIGNIAGYSKVIVKNVDVMVNIVRKPTYQGYKVGGLFGFYGRDGLLFVDDVETNGSIEGYTEVGGLIGYGKEGSVVKIANTTSNVDLAGNYSVGGLIGEIDDNRHKWMIENVAVNATISVFDEPESDSSNGEDFGGLIGYMDERDSDNVLESNELLVDNVETDVTFSFIGTERTEFSSFQYQIDNLGGAIGEISNDNQVRLVDSTFTTDILFEAKNFVKSEYVAIDFDEMGGIVGYSEDSDVLLVDVASSFIISTDVDQFNPESTSSTSVNISFSNVGGMAGEIDSGQFTMVASDFDLDFEYSVQNLNSNFHTYDLYFSEFGGLVGFFDSEAVLLAEDITVDFILSVQVSDIDPADGYDLEIEFYDFGALMGDANGVAFLTNVTRSLTSQIDLLAEVENEIMITSTDFTSDLGNSNPFIFIN